VVFSVVGWDELTGLDLYHPYCDGLFWYNKVELTREDEEAGIQERYELSVSGILSVVLQRVVQAKIDEAPNTINAHYPFSTTPITPFTRGTTPAPNIPFLQFVQSHHPNCQRQLFESNNAQPHLYWFMAKFFKKKGDPQPKIHRPSHAPGVFAREFAEFEKFFRIKTGIPWAQRLIKTATTDKSLFQYQRPVSRSSARGGHGIS